MINRLLLASAMALASLTMQTHAQAQAYPQKPIHIVLGVAAGGGTDIVIRSLTPKLSEALGQPIVVENRVGAGGAIAASYVAKAAPDGYTLMMAPSGIMVANFVMKRSLPYAQKDFTPVSLVCTFPMLAVVNAKVPARTLTELSAYLKANPAKANAAGTGPAFELQAALYAQRIGAPITFVAYKGSNESIQAVAAGDVTTMFVDLGPALGAIRSGNVRTLAVTSPKRLPDLPDVPTTRELGYAELEAEYWMGLFAPAKTPPEVVKRLETELGKLLAQDDIKKMLATRMVEARASTSAQLDTLMTNDIARWKAVRVAANLPLTD